MTGSVRTYARITGVLFLLSMLAGFFGEVYVPSRIIVSGDAAATAKNIIESDSLFRLGFASYLVEAICDITLSLTLYILLRPVRNDLALLAAFFGLVSTTLFGVAEMFYFGALVIVRSAGFSPDGRNALAQLSLNAYGYGAGIFMALYGVAALIRGYLIYRSRYLPRFLGVLLMLAGAGFVAKNFTLVLAPAYASDFFLLPMFLAMLSMTVWFLARGVDVAKWEEATSSSVPARSAP
jgi:Domain of unknown function (DUF4386)